jgi:hypothetical protein
MVTIRPTRTTLPDSEGAPDGLTDGGVLADVERDAEPLGPQPASPTRTTKIRARRARPMGHLAVRSIGMGVRAHRFFK